MTDEEILDFAEQVNPDSGELFICAGRCSGAEECHVFRGPHGFAVVVGDVLRQIYTHPCHRRQGHGLRLLRDTVAAMDITLHLTCEPRHRAFFGRASFRLEFRRRGSECRRMILMADQ